MRNKPGMGLSRTGAPFIRLSRTSPHLANSAHKTDGPAVLRRSIDRRKNFASRVTEGSADLFESQLLALSFVVVLLLGFGAAYIAGHWRSGSGAAEHDRMMRAALEFSPDGNFTPSYDDSILGRFFAPVRIVEIKERIAAKSDAARRQTEVERRQLLVPLQRLVERGLTEQGPLEIIAHPPDHDSAVVWAGVNLDEIQRWLCERHDRFAPEKHPEVDDYLGALGRQTCRETARKTLLRRELQALDSSLSFSWLRIDGAYWVLEVAGWSVFGLLANTLITLFQHSRKRTYSADEFILLFPKLVLTPLVSVVAVALWCSGISDAPINHLNLPVFLIFAFSLGFCTEQLYVAIKDITAWFLSRFVKISEDRVAELAKNVNYAFANPPPPAGAPPPENLKQLRARMDAVAKTEFERGLVAKLSNLS